MRLKHNVGTRERAFGGVMDEGSLPAAISLLELNAMTRQHDFQALKYLRRIALGGTSTSVST
jgi:hypothetical protein